MDGQPCIRGMRFPAATVVRMVAGGMSTAEIIEEHPDLEAEDVHQALFYVAEMVSHERSLPVKRSA